ncbi:unnamed protein product [Trichobilharzia regenti]|nr:unnamed protein product [Trichobilharzia regenti]
MLNGVSRTALQFVQEKRVTVSESSSDSTSLQGITSQSKGSEPVRIYEEEPKSSTSVIKEVESDEVDQIDASKLNICDNDNESADLFLVDRDEMRGMSTTAELNKGSVQLEGEVELRADAVVEGMDTHETVSVIGQRVAHLSTDVNAQLDIIVKDSSGGVLAGRQTSKRRTKTPSDAPLSSSTGIKQSSLVLSSTMKQTPINSSILSNDYASISPFEKTKDIGQFSEDKPGVNERVIVKLTCTNKGIS